MQSRQLSDDLADLARANQQTRDAALLRATTELFVQDLTHDADEIRRYEELATHLLPKVTHAERALVAERLAICADAPPAVVRMLARDVIDVAASIIRRSPVLNTLDLLGVIAATDVDHHRLIARRAALGDDVKRALRLTGDAEVIGYLDHGASMRAPELPTAAEVNALAKQTVVDGLSRSSITTPERRIDLKYFLELDRPGRLRLVADIAVRPPRTQALSPTGVVDRAFQSILSAAQISGFARRGQIAEIVGAIADGLQLKPDDVAAALNDRGGEALAIMLKALRLDEVQAQQVFLLASPVGRDVQAFFPLTDLFAGMEHSTAETLCQTWRRTGTERRGAHEAHMVDTGDRRRSAEGDTARRSGTGQQDIAKRA